MVCRAFGETKLQCGVVWSFATKIFDHCFLEYRNLDWLQPCFVAHVLACSLVWYNKCL